MKLKPAFYTLTLLLLFTLLSSHEFWLEPNKYNYKQGDDINIRFLVGDNFEGDNWIGDSARIKNLTFYFGGVKDENLTTLFGEKGDSLKVKLYDEGTCMVTYNSRDAYIVLDSTDFNAYLIEDGLTDALEYRKQHNELDRTGREFYQRNVKTIFQVGSLKDETYRQSTALPLDIIPLSHPYKLTDGAAISVLILFRNQPLTNARLKLWHSYKGETVKEELITDEKGMITFPIITKGQWMISCVKMLRLEKDPEAEWQSYWGSCTWGYY
jgi:uncharacterized GH25 family protein